MIPVVPASGPVSVEPGGALSVQDASMNGGLAANGATGLSIRGSWTSGSVSVAASTGFVLIGAPSGGCGADTINGSLTVTDNHHGTHVEGDMVRGAVSFNSNGGGGLMPYGPLPFLGGDTISGPLQCTNNTPAVASGGIPNTATGPTTGQCASG